MDEPRRGRVAVRRVGGDMALLIGFAITVLGVSANDLPARSYFLAGFLVLLGIGLRLEAAIIERSSR
ncbi:hypothetical protein [Krasilnikovia sp. MM14-A1259]|uniref:hypothetical protein n=1 Tax=Krasilnikovia sp. MM14-A1259 TaxID=3373539 RepID=UPI00399C5644